MDQGRRCAHRNDQPIETRGVVAQWDARAGRLSLRFPDGHAVEGEVALGEPVETDFYEKRAVPGRVVEGPWAEALSAYAGEPLVHVLEEAPWVSAIAGRHHVELGGFTLADDGRRLVVVATEDNLLKGAATQALQNLNLAFGLAEITGIPDIGGSAA